MNIGNGMTHSMQEEADRAKNGSNFAFKSSVGITIDVSDADGQGDSQGGTGGNRLYRRVRMSDYMCIT